MELNSKENASSFMTRYRRQGITRFSTHCKP